MKRVLGQLGGSTRCRACQAQAACSQGRQLQSGAACEAELAAWHGRPPCPADRCCTGRPSTPLTRLDVIRWPPPLSVNSFLPAAAGRLRGAARTADAQAGRSSELRAYIWDELAHQPCAEGALGPSPGPSRHELGSLTSAECRRTSYPCIPTAAPLGAAAQVPGPCACMHDCWEQGKRACWPIAAAPAAAAPASLLAAAQPPALPGPCPPGPAHSRRRSQPVLAHAQL